MQTTQRFNLKSQDYSDNGEKMTDLRMAKILKFIEETEKLKLIYRQINVIDKSRAENSAEHSWHVSILALLFFSESESNNLDLLKIIKMLLIHDIVEIDAGDGFVFDETELEHKKVKESQAAKRIFSILPEEMGDEFQNLWLEYQTKESQEAKFAKAMDAIQPLISHLLSTDCNENPKQLTQQQILNKKIVVKDISPSLWNLTEKLINDSVAKGLYLK